MTDRPGALDNGTAADEKSAKSALAIFAKWAAGSALLIGVAWWVETQIGWQALLDPWQTLDIGHLTLLVSLVALSYLTRAARLFELYRARLGGPFRLYLRINVLHTTLLNLLPMRTGEAAFPLMMKRHFGELYRNSLANLLWLRVADLWILLALGALLFVFNLSGDVPIWAGVCALAAVLLPFGGHWLRARALRFSQGRAGRLHGFIRTLFGGLPTGFSSFARLIGWTILTWALKLLAFASVVGHFVAGPSAPLIPGIIAAEISNALPIQGVAGFGNYELAMVLGSQAADLNNTQLLSAAVNLHLFILACTLIFGLLALAIPQQTRAAQTRNQSPPPAKKSLTDG